MINNGQNVIVSVLVPYYQERPGTLKRALQSVAHQELPDGCFVQCLVVDDGSPHPADDELPVLDGQRRMQFQIIKQENGGVSAARNTALAHVPPETKFIAFLDSDDYWSPGHLARALQGLGDTSDLYFSDCSLDGGAEWFAGIPAFSALLSSFVEVDAALMCRLTPDELLPVFLADCPAHTSTVVYRAEKFCDLRFDLELRSAGEDHLFWISVVRGSHSITVDRMITATRGHGIDLYRNAQSWDSPNCLQRLCGNLLKYRKLTEQLGPLLASSAAAHATAVRREILAVMLHAVFVNPESVMRALKYLWRFDRAFFSHALPTGARIFVERLTVNRRNRS